MKHTYPAQYRVTHLESVMAKQGRSKKWLAAELGVSISFISKLFAGKRTVNAERTEQIAKAVQVPALLLFEPVADMSSDTLSTSKDMVA